MIKSSEKLLDQISDQIQTVKSKLDLDSGKKEIEDIENETKKADLKSKLQNINLSREYAHKLFWMTVIWLGLVLSILILNNIVCINLSDRVLITLITTTTANVAAYFLVVTKYLFPNK